jgi:hypothetical protein
MQKNTTRKEIRKKKWDKAYAAMRGALQQNYPHYMQNITFVLEPVIQAK